MKPTLRLISVAALLASSISATVAAQTQPLSEEQLAMAATQAARLFHLRENGMADVQRIARVLTGQSVGLVLSGGGARA